MSTSELEQLRIENTYLRGQIDALQKQYLARANMEHIRTKDPDTDKVAEVLDIHVESVRRLIRQGKLAGYKVGMKLFVPQAALDAFAPVYINKRGRRMRPVMPKGEGKRR